MFSGGHQDILDTKSCTLWTNITYALDGHAKKLYRIPYVDKNGRLRLHCVNSVARGDHKMSFREKASKLQTIVTFRAVDPMIINAVLSYMMMKVSPVMPIEVTSFLC